MSHGTTKTKQMFLFLTCMLHDFPKEMCVAGGTDVFLSFLFCTSPDDASLKGGREHWDLISCFWHVWTKDVFACLISNKLETKRQWCGTRQSCEAQFFFDVREALEYAKHRFDMKHCIDVEHSCFVFACSVRSACSVDFALDWCGQGWTEVCFRLQRIGYRVQVRTVPAELRMSGIRIHSHAQLSSCGNLGTPETAKLLHSTPACVCVWGLKQFAIGN